MPNQTQTRRCPDCNQDRATEVKGSPKEVSKKAGKITLKGFRRRHECTWCRRSSITTFQVAEWDLQAVLNELASLETDRARLKTLEALVDELKLELKELRGFKQAVQDELGKIS
jgi:transcriptional regulator NrdR family protein